nr:MAG TPA: hypothetical protein [Caudoviricetes sp.]
MNNAPCRDCASREVGCHAGCERYKAYADQRERVRQNRQDFIIERTTNESRQRWWLKLQRKTRKGG